MPTSRKHSLLVTISAVSLALASCASVSKGGDSSQGGGTLRVALSEDIDNLMVGKLHTLSDRFIAMNIYDGLLRYKPGTTNVEPDLAKSYELSADGLMWTFKLRTDVGFNRGYGTLTSKDVKASFDYQMKEANATFDRSLFSVVTSVETPDPATVVIKMKTPNPSFIYSVLAWQPGYITSARAIDELGPEKLAKQPVGTGAFELDKTLRAQGTTLNANGQYFGGQPKSNKVEFTVIPDQRVAVQSVAQGNIDIAPVSQSSSYAALMEQVKSGKASEVSADVSSWNDFLYFNTKSGPTKDVRIRRAIAYALDLKAINERLGGISTYNPSYFSKAVPQWTDNVETYGLDLQKSRALVAQAGYSSPGDVKLTVAYSKANLYEDLTLRLTDMLRNAGFTIDVKVVPREQQTDNAKSDAWSLNVWASGRVSPDDYATNFTRSGGSSNYPKWSNPDADKLIDAARSEVNDQKRQQLYTQLQQLVKSELPILTLDTMGSILAARPNVKGLQPSAAYASIATLSSVTTGGS